MSLYPNLQNYPTVILYVGKKGGLRVVGEQGTEHLVLSALVSINPVFFGTSQAEAASLAMALSALISQSAGTVIGTPQAEAATELLALSGLISLLVVVIGTAQAETAVEHLSLSSLISLDVIFPGTSQSEIATQSIGLSALVSS